MFKPKEINIKLLSYFVEKNTWLCCAQLPDERFLVITSWSINSYRTSIYNPKTDEYYHGHYHETYSKALQDFSARLSEAVAYQVQVESNDRLYRMAKAQWQREREERQ